MRYGVMNSTLHLLLDEVEALGALGVDYPEMTELFDRLPNASLTLDTGHAHIEGETELIFDSFRVPDMIFLIIPAFLPASSTLSF